VMKRAIITKLRALVWGDREAFSPYLYEAYRSTRRRAPTLHASSCHDHRWYAIGAWPGLAP